MTETLPEYGGCLWPADPACLNEEWEALDESVRLRSLALASSSLSALTARRVGGCPVTVRPCSDRGSCGSPYWGEGYFNPVNWGGRWFNNVCAGCTATCEVVLPAPVGGIYEIKVDGNVLDLDDFDIDNGNILVYRGDGECPFPISQNLSLRDTEVGTFSITYLNAYRVDSIGARAVATLALEFAKACKPKGKCSLPRGVTSVVRNGVSFEIDSGLFPEGVTGIDEVDAFIRMWNPAHRTQQTRVLNVDNKPMRRTSRRSIGIG